VSPQHSRQALAIQRTAIAFARGAWTGLFTIRTLIAVHTASNRPWAVSSWLADAAESIRDFSGWD
jgi:hypothetical protein